jgi:hypothetical protein
MESRFSLGRMHWGHEPWEFRKRGGSPALQTLTRGSGASRRSHHNGVQLPRLLTSSPTVNAEFDKAAGKGFMESLFLF